ncbi:hypothetical protein LR48_Vigan02g151600 [Vigna angularis]|uniref:Uncharacterized protein n=1 Tax=Phaseolus angularis TaxID=3914 RepID=A0A0L9TXY2_PHAAN|nr:hypothetical protein LR48_Vigan02g151600 [Vigna angularis]
MKAAMTWPADGASGLIAEARCSVGGDEIREDGRSVEVEAKWALAAAPEGLSLRVSNDTSRKGSSSKVNGLSEKERASFQPNVFVVPIGAVLGCRMVVLGENQKRALVQNGIRPLKGRSNSDRSVFVLSVRPNRPNWDVRQNGSTHGQPNHAERSVFSMTSVYVRPSI